MKTENDNLKELRACVEYCRQQNGRSACKNCGLNDEMIDNALLALIDAEIEREGKSKNNYMRKFALKKNDYMDGWEDGWNKSKKDRITYLKEQRELIAKS